MTQDGSSQAEHILPLLHAACEGSNRAIDALLRYYAERLTILTQRMLKGFARVKRWAETDDVLQSALVRLMSALRAVKPRSQREFLALATTQIRRELLDLVRRFYGPEGVGANHESNPGNGSQGDLLQQKADPQPDVPDLFRWRDLHEKIETLPQEEREVFELLFYQGLSAQQAAELLGISTRTVQRRRHTALVILHRIWTGQE